MTMIERVARAIDIKQMEGHGVYEIARAAIEAMREPTEAMLRAGGDEPYLATSGSPLVFAEVRDVVAPENIWQAMIDAALEEKP